MRNQSAIYEGYHETEETTDAMSKMVVSSYWERHDRNGCQSTISPNQSALGSMNSYCRFLGLAPAPTAVIERVLSLVFDLKPVH